ncbi:MAG: S8 family serine peptidase [Acidimicrobiia bacterium]
MSLLAYVGPAGGLPVNSSESLSAAWRKIDAPVVGTPEETAKGVERTLGVEVRVERQFELFAPQDEPMFPSQWDLENTGQTDGLPDADVDAIKAWQVGLGTGVVVAIVDSGVDESIPELDDQIAPGGWDFVDWDDDPNPVGSNFLEAHASMVAGVVAAELNAVGITGVAPQSKILNLRACHNGSCGELEVALAVAYAVDNGADIISLSFGGLTPREESSPLADAIEYARQNNVLVVAAAGNAGLDIDDLGDQTISPAGYPHANILSVAATSDTDSLASFSNYGTTSVDIAAPGVDILTTGGAGLAEYMYGTGTSFSAPLVSGIAALLLSHDSGIGYQELIARVEGFADRPSSLTSFVEKGRINAGTTMTMRFIDTSGSLFVNAIDWLAQESITEGCNPPFNHMYCPEGRVTRGEMAVFLSRAFELPATATDYFTDDKGLFYEGAANRLAEAGLTVGCGPSQYCGGREIDRGEFAAMLARALSLPPSTVDHFTDDDGSLFENAINKIAQAGLTEGCNPPASDRFCPTQKVSRGQMAAFIKRAVSFAG